jgi:hypothetical protein
MTSLPIIPQFSRLMLARLGTWGFLGWSISANENFLDNDGTKKGKGYCTQKQSEPAVAAPPGEGRIGIVGHVR